MALFDTKLIFRRVLIGTWKLLGLWDADRCVFDEDSCGCEK